MWNPLSWVMEMAAIMAIALANGDGKPPDWQDFLGIACLLVINSTISFIEENNVGNAAAALMAGLAPKTKVLRDGRWSELEGSILVPVTHLHTYTLMQSCFVPDEAAWGRNTPILVQYL